MSRQLIISLLALINMSGCSTMKSNQQEIMERGALPPDVSATLVRRTVRENGIVCEYSDGRIVQRQNRASQCP